MKKLSKYDLKTIRYALLEAIGSLECDIRSNHVVNPKFETEEDRERERLGYARLGRFKNLLMRLLLQHHLPALHHKSRQLIASLQHFR
jgi:hypothetical protein